MRLIALAALVACPFVACYCTLSYANAAEPEPRVIAASATVHAPAWFEYLSAAKATK